MAQLLFPLSPGGAGDSPAERFPRPDLAEWTGANPRFGPLHRFCREKTDLADFRPHFNRWTDDGMANCALCLAHMVDKALTTVITQKDEEFVTQGGIKERMTAVRLSANSPSTPANASACPRHSSARFTRDFRAEANESISASTSGRDRAVWTTSSPSTQNAPSPKHNGPSAAAPSLAANPIPQGRTC